MYNLSSWGMLDSYWDRLDASHRRHLRKIMNVSWPRSLISIDTLYKRCSSTPLSKRAKLSRWKMLLGQILRSDKRAVLNWPVVSTWPSQVWPLPDLRLRSGSKHSGISFLWFSYTKYISNRTLTLSQAQGPEWKCHFPIASHVTKS